MTFVIVFFLGSALGFLTAAMMTAASKAEWERQYLQDFIAQEKKAGRWKN